MRRLRAELGFTLLELLVGLSLLALIGVLLANALGLGFRAAALGSLQADRLEERRSVSLLLRRSLETAMPIGFATDLRYQVAFEGTPEGIDFIAEQSGRDGTPGLWLIRLAVAGEERSRSLTFSRRLLTGDARDFAALEAVAAAERSVLLEGRAAIEFSFHDGEAWRPRWERQERLPALVRLAVTDAAGVPWPELVAAPILSRGDR